VIELPKVTGAHVGLVALILGFVGVLALAGMSVLSDALPHQPRPCRSSVSPITGGSITKTCTAGARLWLERKGDQSYAICHCADDPLPEWVQDPHEYGSPAWCAQADAECHRDRVAAE
tara:strand:+ start:566 stop:919 length:354 start_codon:yes stop_codon:yes gene_type:complete